MSTPECTTVLSGLTWGEGPRWSDGELWLSDPQSRRLHTDASGEWERFDLDRPSNGLWVSNGVVMAAMQTHVALGRWNGDTFEDHVDLSTIATGPLGDMVGDSRGGYYIDDVGYAAHLGQEPRPGRILYVDPHGSASVAADAVEFPNGLAIVDGGTTLVAAETWNQRLLAWTIGADGSLSEPRLYADLRDVVGPEARPDGICAGADNSVWVATLTGHEVVRLRDGRLRERISTGDGFPIACTSDLDRNLWVTIADGAGLPIMEAIAQKVVSTRLVAYALAPQETDGE